MDLLTIFLDYVHGFFMTTPREAAKNNLHQNNPPPNASPMGGEGVVHPSSIPLTNRERVQLKYFARSKCFILIDDTSSMQTSWSHTREALAGAVERLSAHNDNKDGIDVRFMHHTRADPSIKTKGEFESLFDAVTPCKGEKVMTPKVRQVFEKSLPLVLETPPRPVVFIIVTDGIATDTEELFGAMAQLCQKLNAKHVEPHMFRIQMLQMGDDRKAIQPLHDFGDRVTRADSDRRILSVVSFHRGRGLLDSRLVLKFMLALAHIPDDEDPDLGERQPAEAIAAQYATLESIRAMGSRIR